MSITWATSPRYIPQLETPRWRCVSGAEFLAPVLLGAADLLRRNDAGDLQRRPPDPGFLLPLVVVLQLLPLRVRALEIGIEMDIRDAALEARRSSARPIITPDSKLPVPGAVDSSAGGMRTLTEINAYEIMAAVEAERKCRKAA